MARLACDLPRPFKPGDAFYFQWHLTGRCNLHCRHCYYEQEPAEPDRSAIAEAFAAIRSFREGEGIGRARLQIAGGEPLLSPHLFFVLEQARSAGLPVRILSNGVLVDPAIARALAAADCKLVQLSLDGLREKHDEWRGPGVFEQVRVATRILRAEGIRVTWAMTLASRNLEDLPGVLELASREADRFAFSRLVPCGAARHARPEPLSIEQTAQAFRTVWDFSRRGTSLELPLRDPLWHLFFAHEKPSPYAGGCSAGYGGICLEADGTVFPCRRLPLPLGNVLTDDLRRLWRHPTMEALRDRDRLRGACGRCLNRWRCGGCRAIARAVGGDPFGPDPQCFDRPGFLRNLHRAMRLWLEQGSLATSRAAGTDPSAEGGG